MIENKLEIDDYIQNIGNTIDKLIERNKKERGFLAQQILAHYRNLIEGIFLKITDSNLNDRTKITYQNIMSSKELIIKKGENKYKDILLMHKWLQKVASHYTYTEEISERLMLKYYIYLIKIKKFLNKEFNLNILNNLEEFPLNLLNEKQQQYYENIALKIEKLDTKSRGYNNPKYYIQKIKPFFINNEIFYEITYIRANDNVSKFDRLIAFTKLEIPMNYSVKFKMRKEKIKIFNVDMEIMIIDEWKLSIKTWEFKNLAKIFDEDIQIREKDEEYQNLMKYLKSNNLNLLELLEKENYTEIKYTLENKLGYKSIFYILDKCKKFIEEDKKGKNIIKYFLYKLRNNVIKNQLSDSKCEKLSDLKLKYGSIPFEEMPFCTSLIEHSPKLEDLINCIDSNGKEYQFLARKIKNNTEIEGKIYTSIEELKKIFNLDDKDNDKIESLCEKYNNKLYQKHCNRQIKAKNRCYYLQMYEEEILELVEKFDKLSKNGIEDYLTMCNQKISLLNIDSNEKEYILQNMFKDTRLNIIYGSAGTGKSTLINHISEIFSDKEKIFLTNTNTALENLKRKIKIENSDFFTINRFNTTKKFHDKQYDLLVIDECSTVSNKDILNILKNCKYKLIILVGDILQIEAIKFGNWFSLVPKIMDAKVSVYELKNTYRSNNEDLKKFWNMVREIDEVKRKDDDLLEKIIKQNYSSSLDKSIFNKINDDEIILCLNYDGLYGINNINNFLQRKNENVGINYKDHIYKKGDSILFNENNRYNHLIPNGTKGKILNIEKEDEDLIFTIEIDKILDSIDILGNDIELIDSKEENKSIIKFKIIEENDENESIETLVPFQLAYAISIHKSQGLEWKSVKIVISNEVDELITQNIFYTAITRAKESLKIYWEPEVEKKILEELKVKKINEKDLNFFKQEIKK